MSKRRRIDAHQINLCWRLTPQCNYLVDMGLSYADAVVLMGGQKNRTVAALDRATGGLLLAASVVGGGFVLNASAFKVKRLRDGSVLSRAA